MIAVSSKRTSTWRRPPRTWGAGDVAGNALFKHSGDYETRHVIDNVVRDERRALDLTATAHDFH